MQNKIKPNKNEVKYYDRSIVRFPGEWILINCKVPKSTQSVLSFKPQGGMNHTIYHQLPVDHQKIKLVHKNIYNVTHLTYNDSGMYNCTTPIAPTLLPGYLSLKSTQKVLVLEGKNCQLLFHFY